MPPRAGSQRAWWADVEEVRERIEGRRAAERQQRPATRRTVSITGHPSEHVPALRLVKDVPEQTDALAPRPRRRPPLRAVDRIGSRPDRIASWAVLLGVVLVLVTLLSTHS
jgi:hypothetical protein